LKYGFIKETDLGFDEAIEKVTAEVQKEGFGILTEIDVKATLKKKLDVDYPQYRILGACNPPFAYQALQADSNIRLLLPCNVVVYENDAGKTVVGTVDAHAMLGVVGRKDIEPIAEEVNKRLKKVLDNI